MQLHWRVAHAHTHADRQTDRQTDRLTTLAFSLSTATCGRSCTVREGVFMVDATLMISRSRGTPWVTFFDLQRTAKKKNTGNTAMSTPPCIYMYINVQTRRKRREKKSETPPCIYMYIN